MTQYDVEGKELKKGFYLKLKDSENKIYYFTGNYNPKNALAIFEQINPNGIEKKFTMLETVQLTRMSDESKKMKIAILERILNWTKIRTKD